MEFSAAAGDCVAFCLCRGVGADTPKSPFYTLFTVAQPFADRDASSPPLNQHNSPPPSKFYSAIHELIRLMPGQCANPGPRYSCPVCLRPYIESKYANCRSQVHQKCSGLEIISGECLTLPRLEHLFHFFYFQHKFHGLGKITLRHGCNTPYIACPDKFGRTASLISNTQSV